MRVTTLLHANHAVRAGSPILSPAVLFLRNASQYQFPAFSQKPRISNELIRGDEFFEDSSICVFSIKDLKNLAVDMFRGEHPSQFHFDSHEQRFEDII